MPIGPRSTAGTRVLRTARPAACPAPPRSRTPHSLEAPMPPPPLSPQGNRAGLITAVVVLSILFVTSAIFAFYYSAESSKAQGNVKTLNDKLNQYANNEAQGDPAVQ